MGNCTGDPEGTKVGAIVVCRMGLLLGIEDGLAKGDTVGLEDGENEGFATG